MPQFFLNRIILPRTQQIVMFSDDAPEIEILKRVLRQKPSEELRKGQIWHIGNVIDVDENSLVFAVGRTARSKIEKLDADSGDFLEERSDVAPFTYAALDFTYQVLAIAHRAVLALKPTSIASRIESIINHSPILQEVGRVCEVRTISDPEDFISAVQDAYRVYALTVEFGRPNPWDAEEQFQKPMQNLLHEAEGKDGKATINGPDLKREVVEKLARVTSAAGRDAKLRYQPRHRSKTATKHLKGDTAKVSIENIETPENRQSLIDRVRDLYNKIRNQSGQL